MTTSDPLDARLKFGRTDWPTGEYGVIVVIFGKSGVAVAHCTVDTSDDCGGIVGLQHEVIRRTINHASLTRGEYTAIYTYSDGSGGLYDVVVEAPVLPSITIKTRAR